MRLIGKCNPIKKGKLTIRNYVLLRTSPGNALLVGCYSHQRMVLSFDQEAFENFYSPVVLVAIE